MTEIEEEILSTLKAHEIEYEILEHEPVFTCTQMAKFLKTNEANIAKSMIARKSDGTFILAVLPGNKKINLYSLGTITKSAPISLAQKKDAEQITHCSVGCVYPLGNMINLETFFDESLLSLEYVFFNPGSHTKSVKIRTRALIDLVRPTMAKFT
jgi:Ala-tRNA(Pro) deacylase